MKKQLILGVSILALFAVADVAAAQKSAGASPGASMGHEGGGANMGADKGSSGTSERGVVIL